MGDEEFVDSEEDDGEEQDGNYLWLSSGGCEMCDSMDNRIFSTEPFEPHPKCNCTIIDRTGMNSVCANENLEVWVDHTGNAHHSGGTNLDEESDFIFDYEITCFDDEIIVGQVIVSMTYRQQNGYDEIDDLFSDAMDEAIDLVVDIAMEECQNCGAHPDIS